MRRVIGALLLLLFGPSTVFITAVVVSNKIIERRVPRVCGMDVIAVSARGDTVTAVQVCAPETWWAWRHAHPGPRYVRVTPEGVKYER